MYDLVIDASVDGKLRHIMIPNGSQPFHTRGDAAHYAKIFEWGKLGRA
jgi:hypothetical protein